MMDKIIIKGAREHNLKNIDIKIPKDKMVVITGVSGSGKSSLAFDTIYSEGQRRYVESLSAYARQFIGQMTKPKVDSIDGLSPAISIEQKSISKNPRSTVGTMTEIYDYMRLLYAHVGTPHCPNCGQEITSQSAQEIVDTVLEKNKPGDKLIVLAPVVRSKKGEHKNLILNLIKKGYVRARIDGQIYYLEDEINLDKNIKHNIEVVIDRLKCKKDNKEFRERLTEAIEAGLGLSEGFLIMEVNGEDNHYSEHFACPDCDISLPEITPRVFSFNAPYGACPKCNGLGQSLEVEESKLILDKNVSLRDGGIYIPGANSSKGWVWNQFESTANHFGIDLDKKVKDLTDDEKNLIFYGTDEKIKIEYNGSNFNYDGYKAFEGIVNNIERRYKKTNSNRVKENIEKKFMVEKKCKKCDGKKLIPEVLAVTIEDKDIMDVTQLSINGAINFFDNINLSKKERKIAEEILKEIQERLRFLINVGLDYLTLDRLTKTLSGGEAQRIRLATQIGAGLTGVVYVLDEPSIGLHQRDNQRLLETLKDLRDLGNTLIIVEHDEETIREADYVIDMGPRAGVNGGEIVAKGSINQLKRLKRSITGKYLKGERKIEVPQKRRNWEEFIEIKGAKGHNLKNLDVKIPLKIFTAITGVSGSGKSSLINQTVFPVLFEELNRGKSYPLEYKKIEGIEKLDKVIDIDQSPIGRTPRSNPATYTKVFDYIRKIFEQTKGAKIRGYDKGRFSFNVKGGRCESCGGAGREKIEMNFLPDVYVTCEVCNGKRYNRETLEVYYKGKNIAQVLDMTVEEAYDFFQSIPSLERRLRVLKEVGLEYIKLGQPATTLSGGEAQRIKLASELAKQSRGHTMYILDEPTTGLHFEDIKKLLSVLQRLVDKGNSVVVIEHNLDVIKTSDHIIDLGPEGGEKGGLVIGEGTPEELIKNKKSYTGSFLKELLSNNPE
ncbi:MAG: excinuclease ABC subunit UvrA [Fusobacteriota bacterium]